MGQMYAFSPSQMRKDFEMAKNRDKAMQTEQQVVRELLDALQECRNVLYGYMHACGDDDEPQTHKKARLKADKAIEYAKSAL